jgi:hypothetical protein
MGLPSALGAETDQSESLGRVVSADALAIDVADVGTSRAGFPSDAGPATDQLNVGALDGLVTLDLGGGVELPLVSEPDGGGLLYLGEVGAVSGFAESTSPGTSTAAAGAIGGDGSIAIDPGNAGEFGSAHVNLTALFDQAGVAPVTDGVIDDLDLRLGAVASHADAVGADVETQYVIVDGELVVNSPLVSDLSGALDATVTGVGDGVDTLVSSEGALGQAFAGIPDVNVLLGSISLDGTTVTVGGLDEALEAVSSNLLDGPIANENGVTLDLSTGEVRIDLDQIVECNAPGSDLSSLAPNTEVLSAEFLQCVTAADGLIADAVDDVLTTLTTGVTEALSATEITAVVAAEVSLLAVPPLPGITAPAEVRITGTLEQFLTDEGGNPTVSISLLNPNSALNSLLDQLLSPVTNAVLGVLGNVGGGALEGLAQPVSEIFGAAVDPVISSLAPVLGEVTSSVVSLTINEQATTNEALTVDGSPAADVSNGNEGLLGADSFTVSALTLGVLPGVLQGGDAINLSLASSTVRTSVLEPTIAANPGTVNDGGTTTVTGAEYPALTEVEVQLQDNEGVPIGDPVSVTTDENGGFTTELTVPAGTDPGDFQIVGTAVTPAEESATAPLTVVNEEASLSAQPSSVNDGGTTTVTGEGYPALAEVEVQLQDGEGNPVGDPVTVTTDSNGGFVTDLTVPAGTSEGDYVVVGVSTSGESAQAPLAVTNESTADNTADNTEVNTEVNTAENTEVNTAENDADNTEVNTAENDADNTEVNTAENDADNTEVNTAENDADNTEVNTEVNTAENDADNTEVNTEVNTADNAAENTEVNTEANTSDNTADNTARAEIDVTPKRAVQGVDDVLVTGIGYTPDGTAKAYLRPIAVPESSLMRAIVEPFAAVADPGEFLETVQVDGNGEVAFHVASSQLDVGNYVVTVIDDEDSSLADSVTFSVVPTDTSDNTADNTAENTETNTADNTEANTEVNTAENGADNTEVNTADNAEVNTADNTAENTSDNTGDDATAEDPAVSVDPGSVEAGESTTVTGENFPSNTDVEVQLVDPDGNPVGDPITATTDDDGAFETELTVPEGSAPGDYTVDASAESGENASADLTVTDPSGDDNAADNTGDNAGDNAADNTGDNSSDNAGDNAGDSTADNTADNAGENTGDNTGDDATAEDPAVSVDPGSVEAGDSTTVTGENFPPNTEVDVQLVDADGNPVGDPVSVVTDENGDFSLDVTILDGTPAGEYTVVATAETGETASAALSVTGAGDGNGADNTSDNASDNTGANTGDNTGANTGANTGGSSTGTGGISNGSSGTAGGGGSSSGGYLAQTGATGTAAMVGLAALLLIGGVAGVMISRRSVS